jgi:hypothetical protein
VDICVCENLRHDCCDSADDGTFLHFEFDWNIGNDNCYI